MAENESIGGIKVDIVGDYSTLQQSIDESVTLAAQGGAEIASALSAGAVGADTLTSAIAGTAAEMGDFESRIGALVASGSTLAEALAQVEAESAAITTSIGAAGDAASSAAQQLNLFDESLMVPYANAAGQLNLFATELEPIGPAAQSAASGLQSLGDAEKAAGEGAAEGAEGLRTFGDAAQAVIDKQAKLEQEQATAAAALRELYAAYQEGSVSAATLARAQDELATASKNVGEKAEEAKPQVDNLLQTVLGFAGITVSVAALKSFIEETVNLFAAAERAGEGIAFLRGNIQDADSVLMELRNTAQSLALPFDQVKDAAQKMAFLGLTSEQTAEAINVAADASKASGKSFEAMADTINGMALAGNAMPRTLKQIGVSLDDLADVMDVDANKVQKIFKEMDQPDRLSALIAAMDKTRGASAAMADDMTSNITRMQNSWKFALEDMGGAVAPLALEAIPELVGAFKYLVSAGVLVVTGLKVIVDSIVGITTVALQSAMGLGEVWLHAMSGDFSGAAAAASDAFNNIKAAGKYTWDSLLADAQKGADTLNRIWDDQTKAVKTASDSEIAAQAAAAAAAAQAAAARLAAAAELKKELAEVATFGKAIGPALEAASQSYEDYLVGLLDGGKKASAVLKTLTDDITKGELEAAKMSGAPKAAMEDWIAQLKIAQQAMRDFSAMDDAAKAWTDILDKRAKYAAQVAAAAQEIDDKIAADELKAAQMAEQGELTHQQKLLEIQRTAAAEQEKIHSITALDKLAIDQDIDAKEEALARDALMKELDILDASTVAMTDYASKREAILLKLQALQDKINGKAVVDAIQSQVTAYQVLGVESTKAIDIQIKAADQALQILKAQNAAIGDIYAGEEKELQLRIKRDELTGASATAEIVQLTNIKLAQQALYDQTHLLGDLYSNVIGDLIKGWDQLGKSIADNIVDENNWGQTAINVGKQVAKMILEELVGTAFKALKDSLVQSTGLVTDLGNAFTKLLGGGGGGSSTTISDTFGLFKGNSGGGGGSSASGILGSGGTLGAITGIASLISSIFGNFQMSRLETTMNAVEHNTRYLQIEAEKFFQHDSWDQQTGIVVTLGMIFDRLGDIWNTILQSGLGAGSGPQGGSGEGASGSFTNPTTGAPGGSPSGGSNTGGNLPTNPTNGTSGGYNPYSGIGGQIWGGIVGPVFTQQPSGLAMTSPAAGVYANASSTSQTSSAVRDVYITVPGAGSPRDTARAIADTMRNLSPQFATYSQ